MPKPNLTPEEIKSKINLQGDLIPDNNSEIQPVTDNFYIKGSSQTFESIAQLVAFHPAKLNRGQSVTVVETTAGGQIKAVDYRLLADPELMYNQETLAILVTESNFLNFWSVADETLSSFERVYAYSPDGPGGSQPPYPYESNPSFESNWVAKFDASQGHRWLRFRDDDVDDNSDNIFDNWTVPIAIGSSIQGGDFVENRYAREAINEDVVTSQAGLKTTNLASNDSGWYLVTIGNVTEDISGTVTVYEQGRFFKFNGSGTYTFSFGAEAIQTLPAPPRIINGISNDDGAYEVGSGLESILFTDGVPAGTDKLWEIRAQKSVYGSLKSAWIIITLVEDPNLTRYSTQFTDNPNSIVGQNDPATLGSAGDLALVAAGWEGSFVNNAVYLATRTATGGSPTYTTWEVKKIAGESGEYKERVFKLLPLNIDFDDVVLETPVGADAISQGWSDGPLQETASLINYVAETIKFFDGTLKTPWSVPVPYTGQDTFQDVIVSNLGTTFSVDQVGVTTPTEITLQANLFKGLVSLWINEDVSYVWTRVYNNGAIDNVIADADSGKDFYTLPSSGVQGEEDYKRSAQQLVVKPDGVDGVAVFECVQTFTLSDGSTIVFTEQIEINDVNDGKDAKDLSVTADFQLVLYDATAAAHVPALVTITAFENNLLGDPINWFRWNGVGWDKLTSGVGGYVISATLSGSKLEITAATVFAGDNTVEEERYAASTEAVDPDANDNVLTFSDYITISKTGATAVGSDGADNAVTLLDNETYNVLLQEIDGTPFAGELGASGKASTLVKVYDAGVPVIQGAGAGKYLVSGIVSDNGNVTFNQVVDGNDVRVYVDTWAANERKAQATITIDYETGDGRGTISMNKVFSLNSTLDPTGAIVLVINSATGRYNFTPADRTDIDLNAILYNDRRTPSEIDFDVEDYWFSWKVGSGAFETVKQGGLSNQSGELRTITRAEIQLSDEITVRIFTVNVPSIPTDIFREATIRVSDVLDGKVFRLFQETTDDPPAKPVDTVDVSVGDGSWVPDVPIGPSDPTWAIDGSEKPLVDWGAPATPEYEWGNPYKITGEQGSQGNQGGGYYALFASSELPGGGTADSIDVMVGTNGWSYSIPQTDEVWQARRIYKGVTGTNSPVTLSVAGKLEGEDGSPAVPFDNSVWEVNRISGVDGVDGDDGVDGVDGINATGLTPTFLYRPNPAQKEFTLGNAENISEVVSITNSSSVIRPVVMCGNAWAITVFDVDLWGVITLEQANDAGFTSGVVQIYENYVKWYTDPQFPELNREHTFFANGMAISSIPAGATRHFRVKIGTVGNVQVDELSKPNISIGML